MKTNVVIRMRTKERMMRLSVELSTTVDSARARTSTILNRPIDFLSSDPGGKEEVSGEKTIASLGIENGFIFFAQNSTKISYSKCDIFVTCDSAVPLGR